MATATQKPRTARQLARRGSKMPAPASMKFLVFEDNGGDYHWRIVAHDGAALAQSVSFASYDEAEQAAQQVRKAAASARFESGSVSARAPAPRR
jgi:uncharacterized protein YegP (UPF0339 family)